VSSSDKPLSGINVLVTRPAHQAAFLSEGIRAAGGNPILFPVLEITDVKDLNPLLALIDRIEEFDWAIFVSPNAVNKVMPLIQAKRALLPTHLKFAVVGKGSADSLKSFGVDRVVAPTARFDSEALLDLEELQQMSGKRVVIFRGNGGRQLLGDSLIQRGALLEYTECYYRAKPDVDASSLLEKWSQGEINAVVITSSEGLHNLFDIMGKLGQQLLKTTPIFTTHERIAGIARDLGLEKIVRTVDPGDKGLLQEMQTYF